MKTKHEPKPIAYLLLSFHWINPLWYAMIIIAPVVVFFIEGAKGYKTAITELFEITKTFKNH